jgi:hypothetical protein
MKRKVACSITCKNKVKFKTKAEAITRCEEIEKESGNKLYPYKCNSCNGFHLTKNNDKKRKEIKKKINKIQERHDKAYENQLKNEADYWIEKKGW